jgi:hypothetical protein
MRLPIKVTVYGNLDLEIYCYITKTIFTRLSNGLSLAAHKPFHMLQ